MKKKESIKPLIINIITGFLFLVIIIKPCNAENNRDENNSHGISLSLIELYQRYISPIDGKSCPSYPSCSNYCKQAIRKHGVIMGWLMTVDRLIHEGRHEIEVSPLIFKDGKWKIYDPVENNDFWWYRPKHKEHSINHIK